MKEQLDEHEPAQLRPGRRRALSRARGSTRGDVSFLCALHMKRSMHVALCEALGVDPARAEVLDDTGHMSGVDTLLVARPRGARGHAARRRRRAAARGRHGLHVGGERRPLGPARVKAALVTGAAGGIGSALVERLEADGWSVHGVDVDDADLTTREGNRVVVDAALERFGRLDAVVANAGFQHVAPVEEFPEEQWDRLLALLLTSPFLLAKYAWPALREHGDGRFVAMASAHSLDRVAVQGRLRRGEARRARAGEDARARGRGARHHAPPPSARVTCARRSSRRRPPTRRARTGCRRSACSRT